MPLPFAVLAHDGIALLRPLADAKRIRLELDLQAAPCLGSPAQLAQVITNLLTNAIQFTPEEGSITLQSGNAVGARFVITDTGPGIAPEQLPDLFERFHRGDTSRSRSTGGTGLGLAISKAIVEAHGGAITVDAQAGKGCTFIVQLPAGA